MKRRIRIYTEDSFDLGFNDGVEIKSISTTGAQGFLLEAEINLTENQERQRDAWFPEIAYDGYWDIWADMLIKFNNGGSIHIAELIDDEWRDGR